MEDNFSMARGMGGGMFQAVMRAMGRDGERQMTLRLLTSHLLLCGPVPNRPRTATSLPPQGVGDPCSNGYQLSPVSPMVIINLCSSGAIDSMPIVSTRDVYI